jgi:hypothetical protein
MVKDYETIRKDLKKIGIPDGIPLRIDWAADGSVTSMTYDSEWKEGGTTPVEKTDKKTKKVTVTYKENYTDHKLTKSDTKKLDDYIADLTK